MSFPFISILFLLHHLSYIIIPPLFPYIILFGTPTPDSLEFWLWGGVGGLFVPFFDYDETLTHIPQLDKLMLFHLSYISHPHSLLRGGVPNRLTFPVTPSPIPYGIGGSGYLTCYPYPHGRCKELG